MEIITMDKASNDDLGFQGELSIKQKAAETLMPLHSHGRHANGVHVLVENSPYPAKLVKGPEKIHIINVRPAVLDD